MSVKASAPTRSTLATDVRALSDPILPLDNTQQKQSPRSPAPVMTLLSPRQPMPARSAALLGHEAMKWRALEGLVQAEPVHLSRRPLERSSPPSHHGAEPPPHAPGC